MTATAFKIDAKILAYAPWGGGKRTLAPKIVQHLGPHDEYDEWFVGGCAILPQKEPCGRERINDANQMLVNVLECVRDRAGKLQEWLDGTPFGRDEFELALDWVGSIKRLPAELGDRIELAASQLAVWWMGPNGLAGTTSKPWFATRHTKTGGDPSVRWNSFRRSLPALSERLRNVEITNLDFREVASRCADRAGLAIYCDPPYLVKSFEYAVDFDGLAPHRELAAILNGYRKSRVVVSYYDERDDDSLFAGGSLLDELYPPDRWERHEVSASKASANARTGATKTAATEVLLVNRRAA